MKTESIKVRAVGVNRADVFYKQGKYPSFGLEFAGELNGKHIAGLVDGGAYAKAIDADKAAYIEIPDELSFTDAASLVEALVTSYYNLVELCGVQQGEKVLIHGGGSGIGVAAIQLAKLLGAEIFATAGKPEKLELVQNLGAKPIDYTQEDFSEQQYDVILDIVGGEYFNQNLKALEQGGRLAIISFIGGAKTEANLAPLLTKNLKIYGSTIRSLSIGNKQALLEAIKPYLTKIKPQIDSVLGLDVVDQALERVERYENVGKVVINCSEHEV